MADKTNTETVETPADDTFKGSNGRTYKTHEDGRITEVFVAADHAKRQLSAFSASSYIGGVRISDVKDLDAPAVVVTFDEDESKVLLKTVKEILTARTK